MDLILALDLMGETVVHGTSGNRTRYAPLTWGLATSAEPAAYVAELSPRRIYIADLDRIEGRGDNDARVAECARLVDRCYVDRGCRSPADFLSIDRVVNVVGTETGGADLGAYTGGFLSIDVRDGRVIPSGGDPIGTLRRAREWSFDGCIILNLGMVGTGLGLGSLPLEEMRAAYDGPLLMGGGVAAPADLLLLAEAGFDGAIIATAVHRGSIPLEWLRRGTFC